MEQGGESSKRLGFVSQDRINELPDALLLKILSSLPTKTVIATSVLSKRWRSLWKLVPRLDFVSYGNGNIHKFAENVTKFLLSHEAPVLESLHLTLGDQFDGVYLGVWATIAFARHVREFVLDLSFYHHSSRVRLPSSLFCFDTLETLKLLNYVLLDVHSPVSMKSLRTLHLRSVVYNGDESVRNLFSSCPNLEHLVVHRGYSNDFVERFTIDAPSLKTLSLYDSYRAEKNRGYVIKAPSLRYLEIEDSKGYEYFLIENASELVEASIRNVSEIVNEEILGSVKSVKRLSLDLSPLKIAYPTEVMYYQLVHLEMCTHKLEWWNLLTLMLDISPKLRVLKLIDHCTSTRHHNVEFDKQYSDQGKWNQPKYVPECLLSHLETFVWRNCNWGREEEKEVATYILSNATQLKKATFSMDPIESKRLCKLARRRRMRNELDGVVRASSSCHLVFEFE
ncbi:PREDICTED: F-box/FBD/LRR-repeat protein At3g51530-like [Camelina sativa]|uniref:F-box/FBD/LRR-repeat protein At3g51530-like n=1 Tax=Camelina sativa TaxID=90675 RepID=A0ABM0TI20_CAMSA|nr:PREDICTED: F-box/FBD/LRR-repeat protein At3g51530-like [Camelina sativa]XP_010426726.1 PREDICTED: F-box/FBD/LRR-repeat protein At3g51530-like [Camelina sativa]